MMCMSQSTNRYPSFIRPSSPPRPRAGPEFGNGALLRQCVQARAWRIPAWRMAVGRGKSRPRPAAARRLISRRFRADMGHGTAAPEKSVGEPPAVSRWGRAGGAMARMMAVAAMLAAMAAAGARAAPRKRWCCSCTARRSSNSPAITPRCGRGFTTRPGSRSRSSRPERIGSRPRPIAASTPPVDPVREVTEGRAQFGIGGGEVRRPHRPGPAAPAAGADLSAQRRRHLLPRRGRFRLARRAGRRKGRAAAGQRPARHRAGHRAARPRGSTRTS